MINKDELCQFLVEAKRATYASGDKADKIREIDKSTTLIYEQGDWKYHDNYFGGEPFGGREVVFFKGLPVYIMVYYGWVTKESTDYDNIIKMLHNSLLLIPQSSPYRGPEKHSQGDYVYLNTFNGEVENFNGTETITLNNKQVYRASYAGGLIDQKK
jgi:hypothetical protein